MSKEARKAAGRFVEGLQALHEEKGGGFPRNHFKRHKNNYEAIVSDLGRFSEGENLVFREDYINTILDVVDNVIKERVNATVNEDKDKLRKKTEAVNAFNEKVEDFLKDEESGLMALIKTGVIMSSKTEKQIAEGPLKELHKGLLDLHSDNFSIPVLRELYLINNAIADNEELNKELEIKIQETSEDFKNKINELKDLVSQELGEIKKSLGIDAQITEKKRNMHESTLKYDHIAGMMPESNPGDGQTIFSAANEYNEGLKSLHTSNIGDNAGIQNTKSKILSSTVSIIKEKLSNFKDSALDLINDIKEGLGMGGNKDREV
jgi:ElaB/YqjD/DUF883 family membrane-anchored ribosome-binding protein